jgi:AcrR family transcriptional regulator
MTGVWDVPLGSRERRKETTRRALVECALRLFDERGYASVTVEDICAEVDVSPRTFFRYFASKEQVLAEPITAALDVLREAFTQASSARPVWTALREALLASIEHIEANPQAFLRAAHVVRDSPETLSSSARALLEWELTMRSELEQRLGADSDSLQPRLLLGVAMVGFRTALDAWTESDGRRSLRELLETALDTLRPAARAIERPAARGSERHPDEPR